MGANVEMSKIGMRLITFGLLITSGYLVYLRGGILAWLGLVAALLLVAKHLRRPSHTDVFIALGFTVLWAASWAAAWGFVLSTWESGEVVDIGVQVSDEIHTARVWILDVDGEPIMYYDAPPKVGHALLADAPMTIKRGDVMLTGCADSISVADLSGEELAAVLGVMEEKYQERTRATDVFYSVIGVERDRIGLVLRIEECS